MTWRASFGGMICLAQGQTGFAPVPGRPGPFGTARSGLVVLGRGP